jgi:hypothetical protein
LYGREHGDSAARVEADVAIARALRFRDVAVKKMPVDKRIAYLARAVRPDAALATHLLVALHLEQRRAMLAAFMDSLAIPHDEGQISQDHKLQPPAEAELAIAAAALRERFPADEVELYLASLLAIDPETWGGLGKVLETWVVEPGS